MLNPRIFLSLLVVATLAMTGCGGSTTGNAVIDSRNEIDAAYEAVAAAQIATAVDYSNAILKTTSDPEIKKFAESVIATRKVWSEKLERFTRNGEPMELPKASYALDISLKSLGITADGTPLAAPSTDDGYLAAMKLNDRASLRAASVNSRNGGPGTSQLANIVILDATKELAAIKVLQKR
ncbi:MAG: hypothetical protein JHC98_07655 [Thermoleophilaceae bacterium]|nr:hypothetical protein [Thermoleophilaceae bacterium]